MESWRKNIRGILLLLPFVAIAVGVIIFGNTPHQADEANVESTTSTTLLNDASHNDNKSAQQPTLRPFDPNHADYRTLIEAGVPRDVAVSILRWREAGKVYRIKEDLALCYNMTDSLYFALEPYIVIGNEERIKPKEGHVSSHTTTDGNGKRVSTWAHPRQFSLDTVGVAFLREVGFSLRQAELIVRYRDMIGGYRTLEEFAECYAVDSTMIGLLAPYIVFPARDSLLYHPLQTPITDINDADSVTLCKVRGIGSKSAQKIIEYRELLGGYYDVAQILEIDIVTQANFDKILPQIYCDSSKIKKIYINFAGQNELMVHPYLSNRMLRRIIKHRELKGGWSTIEEMIEDDIFSEDEAMKIAPYLDFSTHPE